MNNKKNPLLNAIRSKINDSSFEWDEKDIISNPAGYSLFSKLIRDRDYENYLSDGSISDITPDLGYLLSISFDKSQDIDDNEAIMQLLPDVSRAAQILIAYILSPTYIDSNPELQYSPNNPIFNQNISSELINYIKLYINKNIELDNRLYDIMYKILFTKGAYILAVIPESSLDDIINPELAKESYSTAFNNKSKERINSELGSYFRPCFGISGKKTISSVKDKYVSNESYDLNLNNIEVNHGGTDNNKKINNLIDTRIFINGEVSYEFPKEIFRNLNSENKKLNDINLSTEGVWVVNFNNNRNRNREDKKIETLVEYSDDLSIIKQGYIKRNKINDSVKETLGISRESFDNRINNISNISDRDIINKLFKNIDNHININKNYNDLRYVKTNKQTTRKDLNEPLVIEYPVESIIPVFKPGSPQEHIGYLVLHDEEGSPLSKVKPINYYRELSNQFNVRNNGSKLASNLIQQGRMMFDGVGSNLEEYRQIEMLSKIHGNAIIKEILNRTREGEYGKNIDIGDSSEAFRIMFYRALKGQRTRILFMPKDIITYFAQDYDNKGIGRSLIDNMKVLLSLRIQFMLAQLRAGIMNSIPETVATIRIDDRDPDPKKTIQIAQALMLKTRQNAGLLIGTSNVQTIEDRINQSNIRIAIESDHPKVPNISHDISRNTADIPTPDNETAELINRLVQMGTLLPPELVDNSYGVDFAREIIQQNFMVSMVVSQIQNVLNPYFTEFVKKVIIASPDIKNKINTVIRSNIEEIVNFINESSNSKTSIDSLNKESVDILIEYITDKFISGIIVKLPSIINDNDDLISEQISRMEERIEKALDVVFSDEALPEGILGEENSGYVEQYRGLIKSAILRDMLVENNYGKEVFDYISVSEDGRQTYEGNKAIRDFSIKTIKNVIEMFKEGQNIAKSTTAVAESNEMSASRGGSSDYNNDDDGGYGDDEYGEYGDDGGSDGSDDFGGFDDEPESGFSDEELDGPAD